MAEVVTSQKLIMGFSSDSGNSMNITVKDALDTLDAETVSTNMDTIISKGVFQYADGDPLAVAETAKIQKPIEHVLF